MKVDRWFVQHAAIGHWYLPLYISVTFYFILFMTVWLPQGEDIKSH